MSELRDLAKAKIDAERTKLTASLSADIEALKRANAAKGLLRSGNTILGVVGICGSTMQSLGNAILSHYRWAVSQSLIGTQSWVEALITDSRGQLQPFFERCVDHVTREANAAGAPNTIPECVAKLEAMREEISTDIALGLRACFAELKRSRLRSLGSIITGWISKLFGSAKP